MDNDPVKKAQKQNQKNLKKNYKAIKSLKKEAGAKGIGKMKFATKSAEGTVGGGKIEVTKKVTTRNPYKRSKFPVTKRMSPSQQKAFDKSKKKGVKVTEEVGTGKYKSTPFRKLKNYKG